MPAADGPRVTDFHPFPSFSFTLFSTFCGLLGAIERSEVETGAATLWSSGTPTRLLAPAAGFYRAMVWLRSSGVSAVYLTRNGSGAHGWRAVWNGGQTEVWSVDAVLAAGDHMEVCVYGGGTISAVGDNSPLCTWQRVI